MLDLYERVWDDEPLGGGEYVLSADEKPGVQAGRRSHPALPPSPARRSMRVENEYARCGTLAYLAAYDVHGGRVIGRCETTTGTEPFTRLVDQVMTLSPMTQRGWCSGSWTTALPTAAGPPPPASATRGRTRSWSTCRCTPLG